MDAERLWKEFVTLPADSPGQLLDFLTFLRSRRSNTVAGTIQQRIDWENSKFIGMWRDREDERR